MTSGTMHVNGVYLFSNSGIVGQSCRGNAVVKLETADCAQRSRDPCCDTSRPAPPTHQIAHVAEGLPDDVDGREGVQEQVLACMVQHSHEDEGTTSIVAVEQRQAHLRGREGVTCSTLAAGEVRSCGGPP